MTLLQLGVARVVVGSAAVERPEEVAAGCERYGPERHLPRLRRAHRRAGRAARCTRTAGGRPRAAALWDAVATFADQRPAACAVHRHRSRRRTRRARTSLCIARRCADFPRLQWQASGGIASGADLQRACGRGRCRGDQRQGAAARSASRSRSCGHSCQTHHPLPRRPRRPGGQGRALSRPPRRRRHPRARGALSRRGRRRAGVLRHHRQPRGPLGRSQLGQPRRARARHSVLRRRRHPLGARTPRQVLNAGAEKISVNSPALRDPALIDRAQRSASARSASSSASTARRQRRRLSRLSVHRRSGAHARQPPRHARLGARSAGARRRRDRAQLHGRRRHARRLRHRAAARGARSVPGAAGRLGRRRHRRSTSSACFARPQVDAALAASVFHTGAIADSGSEAGAARRRHRGAP